MDHISEVVHVPDFKFGTMHEPITRKDAMNISDARAPQSTKNGTSQTHVTSCSQKAKKDGREKELEEVFLKQHWRTSTNLGLSLYSSNNSTILVRYVDDLKMLGKNEHV